MIVMRIHSSLVLGFLVFATICCSGQTADLKIPASAVGSTNAQSASPTNPAQSDALRTEQVRAVCIKGRRTICGKILKIFPDGLVVESGYTSLLRPELSRSWLVPATVPASPDPHLVEGREMGEAAAGLVFLTDFPKSRNGPKPKLYDYAVIQAFPAGQYTYTSVGNIQRTVRRFACGLETAVRLTLEAEAKTNATPANGVQ